MCEVRFHPERSTNVCRVQGWMYNQQFDIEPPRCVGCRFRCLLLRQCELRKLVSLA
jgi:hypothetical protein